MAINPPSDIVLGAVLAADPARYRAAAERLRRAGGDAGAGFEAALTASATESPAWETRTSVAPAADTTVQTAIASPPPAAAGARAAKAPDAFAQLEAFVLQSFIETMLPSNSQAFFGKGTAGQVWKSMLAEKLGSQIASSGQIGLAKRLAEGRIATATAAPLEADASVRMPQPLPAAPPYIQNATPEGDSLLADPASAPERS
ncbi:MAG TPA: rod-binding protein [Hyphomicrobiaceae bacterium]|nr:rod-binding protein [Hyphomicrobiaceae bacterium]